MNTLFAAAGIGDFDRLCTLYPASNASQREAAMLVAAQQGDAHIVCWLLDQGVDVAANHGMTALHNAAAGGHVALVDLLLARGAPLEAVNEFGGTVLGSTLWFAYHVHAADAAARNFPRMLRHLIGAGARTDAYPDMLRDVEGVSGWGGSAT